MLQLLTVDNQETGTLSIIVMIERKQSDKVSLSKVTHNRRVWMVIEPDHDLEPLMKVLVFAESKELVTACLIVVQDMR